jgi:Mg-chelatase subunit ChlD
MTKGRNHLIFILMIVLILSSTITNASPLNELNAERLAVSLVIDTSGSMTVTDPNLLRSQVADIFIDLLNPDDYLGIVTFNSKVDLVVPMTKMESQDTRYAMKTQLAGRLAGAGDTDYTSALQTANKQLEELYVADVRKLIIFLTDGKPDPDPINITANPVRMGEYMTNLWGQVGEIAENGYPVYSIGLSEGIDVEVLNRLASDTGGDIRIYKDSAELDANLIQILQSREQLMQELLAPAIIQASGMTPVLNNEFWPKSDGYRLNESESAVASISVSNQVMGEGLYLKVGSMQLMIEREDGVIQSIDLYDNGDPANDDIKAGDGKWSNRVVFGEEYTGKAQLKAELEYRGKAYSLTKDIGKIMVAMPGTVTLTQNKSDVWSKSGDQLILPLTMNSQSPFKEVFGVTLLKGEGTLVLSQIEVSANSVQDAKIVVQLPEDMNKEIYEYTLTLVPIYPGTAVTNSELTYNAEIVGFFGGIAKSIEENMATVIAAFGLLVVLPFLIYIFGILLYGMLVSPASKLWGNLSYWKENEPENKKELNLKKLKGKTALLSFDTSKKANAALENNRFKYDILIEKRMLLEGNKFLLGWKRLFSKKTLANTFARCTQPGILENNGNISTELRLYDGAEFTSGGYKFQYTSDKSRRSKDDEAGRDILEGRTNGI